MQFLYLRYTNIKVAQHVKTHFTQLQFSFYLIVYNLLRNLALLFYLVTDKSFAPYSLWWYNASQLLNYHKQIYILNRSPFQFSTIYKHVATKIRPYKSTSITCLWLPCKIFKPTPSISLSHHISQIFDTDANWYKIIFRTAK